MKRRNLPFSLLLIVIVLGGFTFGFFSFADHPEYKPRDPKNQLKNRPGKPAAQFLAKIKNNQHTGVIAPENIKRVQSELEKVQSARGVDLDWKQMGPDNFGGRTRAIVIKQSDNSLITYAAGVSGGIWKSTNLGTTWKKINTDDDNLNVSCMVIADNGDIYAGTGETFDTQLLSGLNDMGYTSGFMGQGVYRSTDGERFTLLSSTKPEFNNMDSDWAFVNELAVHGSDKLFAATNTGLKYSTDGGATWATAKDTDGNELNIFSWDVQVGSEGNIIACVDNKGYVSSSGDPNQFVMRSTGDSVSLPESENVNRIEFAIAPTDANIIYASVVGDDDNVYNIYKSDDKGVNWRIIMPGTSTINIFNDQGTYNNALEVFPDDPNKVLLGGIDMWKGEMYLETGYYDWVSVSQSLTGPLFPTYVHEDQHVYTFVPGTNNQFFAGTDGGVYLGSINSQGFSFQTGNRNYFTTQFYAVGISGLKHLMLGGAQDIATIKITGKGNTEEAGTQIFTEGEGGPCAISIINPEIVVVSTVDGIFRRSDDGGENYSTYDQFPENDDITNSAFRTALILSENFTNENSADSVWYYAKELETEGTTVQVISHNQGQPFPYVIPDGITLPKGDSLLVKDIVTSYLYIGVQHNIWMCPNVLQFAETAEWFRMTDPSFGFVGKPYSMALSNDGNHLFVGTLDGRLYRLSNLATANTYERADIESPGCVVSTTEIILKEPGSGDQISQVITGISIDPQDPNNVLVTLGNYGNENYVLFSENALDQFPEFNSRQGNLPHMPIYSCLIEMANPDLAFVGTEYGVFVTENIHTGTPVWDEVTGFMGRVPVWELKQQTVDQPERKVSFTNAEGEIEYMIYPGTKNFGSIYSATYGRGLWRNDDFYRVDIDEFVNSYSDQMNLKLYPNPVQTSATVEIEMEESANTTLKIYDITGKLIMEKETMLTSGLNKISFDFSRLKKGSYIMHADVKGKAHRQKFIIN